MNRIDLIGRIANEVELKYTPSGQAAVKLTLAVDRRLSKEKKELAVKEQKPTADFLRVLVWGKSAEFVAKYLHKGDLASVEGSVRTGHYETAEGQRVYTTDVHCEKIQGLSYKKKNDEDQGSRIEVDGPSAEDFEIEEVAF